MNLIIETMVGLMMMFAYNTNLLPPTDVSGEHYYAHQAVYFEQQNKTCAVWHRYYVWGEFGSYNNISKGLQIWCYDGKVTNDTIKKDGRERADSYILVDTAK